MIVGMNLKHASAPLIYLCLFVVSLRPDFIGHLTRQLVELPHDLLDFCVFILRPVCDYKLAPAAITIVEYLKINVWKSRIAKVSQDHIVLCFVNMCLLKASIQEDFDRAVKCADNISLLQNVTCFYVFSAEYC